jgi:hypothetical protein
MAPVLACGCLESIRCRSGFWTHARWSLYAIGTIGQYELAQHVLQPALWLAPLMTGMVMIELSWSSVAATLKRMILASRCGAGSMSTRKPAMATDPQIGGRAAKPRTHPKTRLAPRIAPELTMTYHLSTGISDRL